MTERPTAPEITLDQSPRIVEVAFFDRASARPSFEGIETVHDVGPGRWWLMAPGVFDAGALQAELAGRAAVFDLVDGCELVSILGTRADALISRGASVRLGELSVGQGCHLHLWHVDVFAIRCEAGMALLTPASFADSLIDRLRRSAADIAEVS